MSPQRLLLAFGNYFVWKLVEAPRRSPSEQVAAQSALHALRDAVRKSEVRWLLVLYIALSTATYMGFWLSAPAYQNAGIPVLAFAAILAVRNLWKAWWSRYHPKRWPFGHMVTYAILAFVGFVGMASGQLWLIWLVLAHDVVHALQGPVLLQRLNGFVPHSDHRATLNSGVNLLQRLAFTAAGPLAGLAYDLGGLMTGLLLMGTLCSGAAFFALARLHKLGTFHKGR